MSPPAIDVLRSLKAGAEGYLLKDSAEGDLMQAIRSVNRGKTFFSPEVSRMLTDDYNTRDTSPRSRR